MGIVIYSRCVDAGMARPEQELLFNLFILLATGAAQTSYMLGIGIEPLPTLGIGTVLIGIGVATSVPSRTRVPAAVTGLSGMVLAGGVVPRYAARAVRPADTLWVSLLLAGVILLLTFAILHLTAFGPRAGQPT